MPVSYFGATCASATHHVVIHRFHLHRLPHFLAHFHLQLLAIGCPDPGSFVAVVANAADTTKTIGTKAIEPVSAQ